jgi:IS30 family transposase
MKDAEKIRDLAAKGVGAADIARVLGVSRQAVHAALKRKSLSEARYEGKDGCRITVRLTSELCAAVEKARRKDETRTDCVTRLIEKGLRA